VIHFIFKPNTVRVWRSWYIYIYISKSKIN